MSAESAIRGDVAALRPATVDDAPRLCEILTSPETRDWWHGYDVERCRSDLARPHVRGFMIEVDGADAGFIQYSEEDDPDYRHATIDIALHADWHGRGIGTDAVRALARHLLNDLGHHRLTIDPALANKRAIRCYEKVGFRQVGVLRRYERGPDGIWHDSLLMDLLAEELR
ncbi:MAG TPA: GNAT family protein [Egibacteraceae bacterium]|nr:GNAT family protein [Egibacteraceae bacterium]